MSLIEDQQHLAQWVRNQRTHLDIAVAFWGTGAVEQLGLDESKKSYRILLDLSSGGSNPSVVEQLLALRPKLVRCVDRLHAKAFIGKSEVVIGSANASANGLGAEGSEATHWCELGLSSKAPGDVAAAQAWFKTLWDDSKKITPKMLAEADAKWKKRQKLRPQAPASSTDLLTAASENPKDFMNRGIYVTVSTEKLSSKAEKVRVERAKETKAPAYMFEQWPKMPVNAHLISFTDFGKDGIRRDGPGVYHSRVDKQRGPYFWVDKSSIEGFDLGPLQAWRKRLEQAKLRDSRKWNSDYGFVMDLGKFVEKYPQ